MVAVNPVSPPAPYERGEKTRAEMAAEQGVSERHHRRLLAKEREARLDLPWVELVDGTRPPTPHYDLATDRLEKPAGAFRIADGRGRLRVKNAGEDKGKRLDNKKKPAPKFKPKSRKVKKRPVPAA